MEKHWNRFGIIFLLVAGAVIVFVAEFGKDYNLSDQNLVYTRRTTISGSTKQELLETTPKPLSHRHQADTQLVDMIIGIEDKRFWMLPGVDPLALGRVVFHNLRNGDVMGASTIDQQVIKLIEQAYERTRNQKVHEIVSALLLQTNSKDEILTSYLNLLPFPYNKQGIQEGCLLLFGLPCKSLTNYQRLFLIATYQTGNNPFTQSGFISIKKRTDLLCNLWKSKYYAQMICEGENITPKTKEELSYGPSTTKFNPTLLELVQQEIKSGAGVFNTSLTEDINKILDSTTARRDSIQGKDCCVLIVDNNGHMISQNTCRSPDDEEESYVNGCFQKRQVGSLMKPFVYLYALEKLDRTMQHRIVDEPISFTLPHGGVYNPQNFDLQFHGDVSLAEALASSLNIPAVKVLHEAGIEGYFTFFNRLRTLAGDSLQTISTDSKQFNEEQLGLSVALGTYELSPYQAIRVWRLIYPQAKASDINEYDQRFTTLHPLREEIFNVLSEGSYRIHGFTHPERFTFPGRSIKTGTSRHYVDGWMCGIKIGQMNYKGWSYPPGTTMCVRMGNYKGDPMSAAGADSAGILRGLVEEVLK